MTERERDKARERERERERETGVTGREMEEASWEKEWIERDHINRRQRKRDPQQTDRETEGLKERHIS